MFIFVCFPFSLVCFVIVDTQSLSTFSLRVRAWLQALNWLRVQTPLPAPAAVWWRRCRRDTGQGWEGTKTNGLV